LNITQEIEVVKGRRPWLAAVLVFISTLALGGLFVSLASSRRYESARHQALDHATQRARAIEGEIQRIASALYPIAAILGQRGKADSLDSLAPLLLAEPLSVVGVAVAPDGVVSELGPLSPVVEANQDLRVDPRLGPAVNAALSERELTMAGPFSAGRLGAGVALCLPLVAARDDLDRPWGVLLATVSVRDLLSAGKAELLASSGLDYHLASVAESGRPLVLARSTENDLPDPVIAEVRVPNGVWTLALAPAAGWDNTRQTGSQIVLAFAAALAAALTILGLAREPDQLRAEAASGLRAEDARGGIGEKAGGRRTPAAGDASRQTHWPPQPGLFRRAGSKGPGSCSF
jgi:sensor domain CHASE-containing protein